MSPAGQTSPTGPTPELLIDLATRFYLDGQSQIEISRQLGLDPSTVSRQVAVLVNARRYVRRPLRH